MLSRRKKGLKTCFLRTVGTLVIFLYQGEVWSYSRHTLLCKAKSMYVTKIRCFSMCRIYYSMTLLKRISYQTEKYDDVKQEKNICCAVSSYIFSEYWYQCKDRVLQGGYASDFLEMLCFFTSHMRSCTSKILWFFNLIIYFFLVVSCTF